MSGRVTRSATPLVANQATTNNSPTGHSTSSHPQIGYMHIKAIQYQYSQLKPKSLEANVGALWINILHRYFDIEEGYGIALQHRPWPGFIKTTADLTIRTLQNVNSAQLDKVVLIADDHVSDESSDTAWKDAVHQVTKYMKMLQTSQYATSGEVETMYAIATVGRYSRFYELQPGEQELQDYGNTDGRPYEFKKDEGLIDTLLLELVDKTSS